MERKIFRYKARV